MPGRLDLLAISVAGFTNVGSTCTFLGAIEKPGITTNGVIYHVNDFEKTKERETGYTSLPESVASSLLPP